MSGASGKRWHSCELTTRAARRRSAAGASAASPVLPVAANAQKFEALNKSWPDLEARYAAEGAAREAQAATLRRTFAEARKQACADPAGAAVAASARCANETSLEVARIRRRLAEARLGAAARASAEAAVSASESEPEAAAGSEDEEDDAAEGPVDLVSSSDEEGAPASAAGSGVLDLISSDDDAAPAVPVPAAVADEDVAGAFAGDFDLSTVGRCAPCLLPLQHPGVERPLPEPS